MEASYRIARRELDAAPITPDWTWVWEDSTGWPVSEPLPAAR